MPANVTFDLTFPRSFSVVPTERSRNGLY